MESSNSLKNKKIKKLQEFINTVGSSPEQRSKEWYAIKQLTIGGSEISTILDLNPFRSTQMLIAEKIGINQFEGNTATRWGTMFEYITKKWTEYALNMEEEIAEVGSIEGIIPRQRYSPDGLGIIKLKCNNNMCRYFIVLFEFKAPLSSLPNGKIPQYYEPQVQTGLLSIPITDIGIFINNCYRICSLNDLDFTNNYNEIFHSSDFKKRKTGLRKITPLAHGVIMVYQDVSEVNKLYKYLGDNDTEYDINDHINEVNYDKKEKYFNHEDIDLLYNTRSDPIDFGSITEDNKHLLHRIFELYDKKRVKVVYKNITPNVQEINNMPFVKLHSLEKDEKNDKNDKNDKNEIPSKKHKNDKSEVTNAKKIDSDNLIADNSILIGYIPWKLFYSDIIQVDKDPEWKTKIEDKVNDVINIIDTIIKSEDPIKEYNNVYSDSLQEHRDFINDIGNSMDNLLQPSNDIEESTD